MPTSKHPKEITQAKSQVPSKVRNQGGKSLMCWYGLYGEVLWNSVSMYCFTTAFSNKEKQRHRLPIAKKSGKYHLSFER